MKPFSRRIIVALALAATTCGASVATAAGTTVTPVTLKLKGEYAKRHTRQCGKSEDFRLYHARSIVEFKGEVTPPPAGHFPVHLEIKRCVRGHWVHATDHDILGKKLTGRYKGFFGVRSFSPRTRRGTTYLVARAIVSGHESRKVYFAVTR